MTTCVPITDECVHPRFFELAKEMLEPLGIYLLRIAQAYDASDV